MGIKSDVGVAVGISGGIIQGAEGVHGEDKTTYSTSTINIEANDVLGVNSTTHVSTCGNAHHYLTRDASKIKELANVFKSNDETYAGTYKKGCA